MGTNNSPRRVKSDETLFAILKSLKESNGAGVTELAKQLNLAKSSIHRHLKTMEDHGFVVNEEGKYKIGLQFLNYGEYARNRYEVYQASKQQVEMLAAETGEMAWLIAHENGMVMYLYGAGGDTELNVDTIVGTWTYMHYNSGGKAILAHLPRPKVEEIVANRGLPAKTEQTITDSEDLFEELAEVRDRGFALNMGEDLEGIRAVGVPIIFEGRVHGALSVAGPAHRLTKERCVNEISTQLLAAADDVELNLAYK
ncbi:IclR family transcriptional regulator [Halegenticoccus soli]|uniref:IclR family transcriptional regulator n=1 Tax=Halegenticoccus soli TaxID=1985678 RepID=UPI000C6E3490|nr:IclR family transcriptional regulator [Halegenticoccus soli]